MHFLIGGHLSCACIYPEFSSIAFIDVLVVGYQLAQNSLYKHCMATAQAWREFAGLEYCFHTGL